MIFNMCIYVYIYIYIYIWIMLQATGDNYSGASLQPLKLAFYSSNQKCMLMQMLAKNGVYRHFSWPSDWVFHFLWCVCVWCTCVCSSKLSFFFINNSLHSIVVLITFVQITVKLFKLSITNFNIIKEKKKVAFLFFNIRHNNCITKTFVIFFHF